MRLTSRKNVLLGTFMLACVNLTAQVTSTFNTTAEGWTTPNDADATIAYSATGGNPGGFVFGTPFFFNLGAGTVYVPFYFVAPPTYLGNRSAYYNGALQYDVQQSTTGAPNQYAEVTIANSLGITLYYFPTVSNQPPAAPTWATYSVTLNNILGFWKTTNSATGTSATEAQLQNVLADLASLQLRGLYRDANTTNRLDNVSFRPPITITAQPASSAICDGITTSLTAAATNNPAISYQWQHETSPTVWSNVTNTGGYSGATTSSLSINTTGNFGAGNYRCRISGTAVNDAFTNTAVVTVNPIPAAPTAADNDACGSSAITLSAAGGAAGQYRWYTVSKGGAPIAGQTNSSYTTPVLASTTTFYVSINNGTCESPRTPVVATINIVLATITQTDNILTASTGDSFQWFLFGKPIADATNETLEINLYETGIYAVEVTQGKCSDMSDDFVYLITDAEKDQVKIKLYPNPITEELTVETPLNLIYSISIVDMLGQQRAIISDNGIGKQTISLKDFQSGSYILVLKSAQSKSYFKIVKQ